MIIPEGHEGKGWEDCQIQLKRLKAHFEKQKEQASRGGASEGTKIVGQMSGMEGVVAKEIPARHSNMGLERVKSMAIDFGDHDMQQIENLAPQHTGDEMQELKNILVSLQSEIARCL